MRPFAVSTAATRWYYKRVDDSDAIISHIQWQSSKDAFRQLNLSPTKERWIVSDNFFLIPKTLKKSEGAFFCTAVYYIVPSALFRLLAVYQFLSTFRWLWLEYKEINWVYMSSCIDLIGCGPTKAPLLCYSWQLRIWSWVGTFAAPNSLICSTSSELELTGVSWAHNVGV